MRVEFFVKSLALNCRS